MAPYLKPTLPPSLCSTAKKKEEAKPKDKVPERRLWLHGSVQASPGTMGLYRTARTEPMGERLRLLYNGSWVLGGLTGNKHDMAGEGLMWKPPIPSAFTGG